MRVKEHQAYTKHRRKDASVVAEHALIGHDICWNAEVKGKERILRKRRIKERSLIDQQKNAGGVMNNDRGWELSNIWLGLF